MLKVRSPAIRHTGDCGPSARRADAGMIANVPLQMLIYFNSVYSIAWGALWISLYAYKYSYWKADLVSAFLNPILFAIWALIEPLRLWFGNSGNLGEKACALPLRTHLLALPGWVGRCV